MGYGGQYLLLASLVTCNVGAIASTTDEKYRLAQAISYTILEIFK
jgi:hypothetical protein